MSDLLIAPRPARARQRRAAGMALLVIAMSALAGTRLLPANARFVDHITVVNPLPFQVKTDAAQPGRDAWLALGATERQETESFERVFDLGREWLFRFSYAGVDGGQLAVSRQALAHNGWRVTVPTDVGRRFEAAGLLPSGGGR